MLIQLLPTILLLAVTTAQEAPNDPKSESKQNENQKPPVVLLASPLNESQPKGNGTVPETIKQFYAAEQTPPELYQLTYLQPQYQAQAVLPRFQPQIVLFGAGGQGQPILINPGNPPGNFLIPQGPGPNVILRNNPQGPQGPLFPVAGYPKPAHIPPIEKDAEEIPTNPANIPPLPTNDGKPTSKPKANKPEKLETFTETTQPDQTVNGGQVPQFSPESVSLRPGQRFFVLNGDNIYSYPFEAQPEVPEFPAFRYTQVQQNPFPQNPPKSLQPFAQEPPQFLQVTDGQPPQGPISVPNLLLRNSFVNSQQPEPQQEPKQPPSNDQQSEKAGNDGALKTAQQYFRTGQLPNDVAFVQNPQAYLQDYLLNQQGIIVGQPQNQPIQGLPTGRNVEEKDRVVQPQIIGQFRFVPETAPAFYQFRDDVDNDAIVVDASLNDPVNFSERIGDVKAEDTASSTTPNQNEPEPSMAQAGPQATAIAGPGGVAGSAPRGTAIAGKGGLAVSSPQATAVAGTKDDEKKKRPVKKDV